MNSDGTMARMPELEIFAAEHDLKLITVVDLIKYRMKNEKFVRRIRSFPYESAQGSFNLHVYENLLNKQLHIVFTKGDIESGEPVLLRVQVSNVLEDVFNLSREVEGSSLRKCLEIIEAEGRGALVYLRLDQTEETLLQEIDLLSGDGTAAPYEETDVKDFGLGAQIVADLGISEVRLLTNHPRIFVGLSGYGININEYLRIGE